MTSNYYKKQQRKAFKERLVKGTKIFLQKKNIKSANIARERYRNYINLSEKENEKKR